MTSIGRICAAAGALGLVVVAAVALLLPRPGAAQGVPARAAGGASHLIVVTGEGSVEAAPDEAMLTVGVQTVRKTAQDAQSGTNTVIDEVIGRIAALGIPRDRMRTSGVELSPQRGSGGTGPITGYAATNRVTITVDDLGMAGRIVDAAVGAGANELQGLSFGLRDSSGARTRALRLAVQNAQATASALAAAAGAGPIHLVRIEQAGTVAPPRFAVMAESAPVLPGTITVTANVRVTYAFRRPGRRRCCRPRSP